mgnify:CR=1 FL=1
MAFIEPELLAIEHKTDVNTTTFPKCVVTSASIFRQCWGHEIIDWMSRCCWLLVFKGLNLLPCNHIASPYPCLCFMVLECCCTFAIYTKNYKAMKVDMAYIRWWWVVKEVLNWLDELLVMSSFMRCWLWWLCWQQWLQLHCFSTMCPGVMIILALSLIQLP